MTEAEKLVYLKTLIGTVEGDGDTDEVLSVYLTVAGRKIIAKAYPYDDTVTEVPERYDTLQCEIAAYLLNKRGAEGQVTHSENGIQRQYENADVPTTLLSSIVPYCGVIKFADNEDQ